MYVPMKKILFSLALTALVAGSALATDGGKGGDKNAKKAAAKKECSTATAEKKECAKPMAGGGHSCCASKNKTASLISPEKKDIEASVKIEEAKVEKKASL